LTKAIEERAQAYLDQTDAPLPGTMRHAVAVIEHGVSRRYPRPMHLLNLAMPDDVTTKDGSTIAASSTNDGPVAHQSRPEEQGRRGRGDGAALHKISEEFYLISKGAARWSSTARRRLVGKGDSDPDSTGAWAYEFAVRTFAVYCALRPAVRSSELIFD